MNTAISSSTQLSEAVTLFEAAGLPTESLHIPCVADRFPERDDIVASRVDDARTLLFTGWRVFQPAPEPNRLQTWLLIEGTPVAFLGLYVGRNPTGELTHLRETVIGAVEVRKQFRGSQLGATLAHLLADFTGHKIHSSGHFSPEGWRSLAGKFPYIKDTLRREADNAGRRRNYSGAGVWLDSLDFVKDWDALQLISLEERPR